MPEIFTGPEFLELLQLTYRPLLILTTALVFHGFFFKSYIRRTAVFVLIARSTAAHGHHTIHNTFPAYALGLVTAWIIIVSATLLLCHDPVKDFIFHGERAPAPILDRLVWTWNLLTSPRRIGWDSGTKDGHACRGSGKERESNEAKKLKAAFLKRQLFIACIEYLVLDLCVHLVYQDSFLSSTELNPFVLPASERQKWFFLLPYRLLVAGVGVYTVLDLLSNYITLLFVGVLGEKLLGSWGQYQNYPPLFGSIWSIWNRGLAGFWGEFWHPVFKFGFTSVAKSIIPIPSQSTNSSPIIFSTLRFLRLLIVFILSGLIHAAGSYTLASSPPNPTTYPLLTLLCFVLQAPGIMIQQFLFHDFAPWLEGKDKVYERMFRAGMLVFTCLWSLCSFPFLVADFAAGGLFKVLVIPFSVIDIVVWGVKRLVG